MMDEIPKQESRKLWLLIAKFPTQQYQYNIFLLELMKIPQNCKLLIYSFGDTRKRLTTLWCFCLILINQVEESWENPRRYTNATQYCGQAGNKMKLLPKSVESRANNLNRNCLEWSYFINSKTCPCSLQGYIFPCLQSLCWSETCVTSPTTKGL